MTLPLLIGGVCIITSIIGTYHGPARRKRLDHGRALQGLLDRRVLGAIPAIYFATQLCARRHARDARRRSAGVGGATDRADRHEPVLLHAGRPRASPALLVWITEYYTGTNYRPVQSIARASQTGHGTNVIQGLAISLESTALPTLVIVRRASSPPTSSPA